MINKGINKSVNLIHRDFSSVRDGLIEFLRIYFPNNYNDFDDASVGMMTIELMAYISEVLSFYQDVNFTETLFPYSTNRDNIVLMAQNLFGYRPKIATESYANFEVYQIVPSVLSGSSYVPDYNYALKISNLEVGTDLDGTLTFRPYDQIINFADNPEVSVYSSNNSAINYFLLKKVLPFHSGNQKTLNYTVSSAQKYLTIPIPDKNVISVDSIIDSDGNEWFEVPYLAMDKVVQYSDSLNDPKLKYNRQDTPYILKYKSVQRRFITRIVKDQMIIQFGSGVNSLSDEYMIPDPRQISYATFNKSIDPRNFMLTRTYGLAPSNTELIIKYSIGYTGNATATAGTVNIVKNVQYLNDESLLDKGMLATIKQSVAAINIEVANGGPREELYEIKENAMANYASQMRCVTAQDYEIRALSMDPKFGRIAKAKAVNNAEIDTNPAQSTIGSIGLYCLGYSNSGTLQKLNTTTKTNLKNYINQFRMLTDAVEIRDAYIINIGINFDIIVINNIMDKKTVLFDCLTKLKDYFNVKKWTIGEPISINDVYLLLLSVPGVRNVKNLEFINKYDSTLETYSNVFYDIPTATINDHIYPALDPSIFEVKYPDNDIQGRIIT